MAAHNSNLEQFETYFQKADLDRDGWISGNEAVSFLQGSNLPRHVLAQIWMYADHKKVGFLGRPEFYNALKLVTVAQSKRELTPDIVKAALYGPASVKIPAPKITLATLPIPQSNAIPGPSPAQSDGTLAVHGIGGGAQSQSTRPTWPQTPSAGFPSQSAVSAQEVPVISSSSISQRPNSMGSLVTNDGSQVQVHPQVSERTPVTSAIQGGFNALSSAATQSNRVGLLQSNSLISSSQGAKGDSKDLLNGNGLASDSMQGKTALPHPSTNVSTMSSGNVPSPGQPNAKLDSVYLPPSAEAKPVQFTVTESQYAAAKKPPTVPVAAGQSPAPWPKMTPLDFQRYSKIFVQVDRDQDGKITGEQAWTLFLSWRLPREVLKKVWDLSDQDSDTMLSLREFCIALYLMERYREGRALPNALPDSVIFDQASMPGSNQPAIGNTSWRPYPGLQQAHGIKNAQSAIPAGVGKPPRPVPSLQSDVPIQRKAKVPELESHLLNQLSTEEQDSLNKKFEEAKDSEKKVTDLEKEILEAKQKIQYYHAKMQELILYKSRCDNRLNEISEKVVADKREVDSLAKRYEEKYKQVGDVASKLTIEEATFRDIQERKMRLYKDIVTLEQDNVDGFEDRAKQIQSDLEALVKALNERCKTYGLRGKPTTLVELPFGWQPGIEATTADWDDAWDKFEDEGFSYVKELTLEVDNVIAPPKPKTALQRENITPLEYDIAVKSLSEPDKKTELSGSGEKSPEIDGPSTHNLEKTERSPTGSPAGNSAIRSWSKVVHDFLREKETINNGSPREFDTRSDFGSESVLSGEMRFDEPHWGSFDANYDTDSAWDFNSPKGNQPGRQNDGFLFSGDDWGLNPIRTGSKGSDMNLPKQSPFFDSVPSTPLYSSAGSPHSDNLLMRNSPFAFADSVPSTPMYNSTARSPKKEEQYSFQSFSRFDSFNTIDSAPFGTRDSFARFDSMRSTRDSDFDHGYFAPMDSPSLARFDSFRSTADSDYNFGHAPTGGPVLARFDSVRSTTNSEYNYSIPSFDDAADPFGGGTFRTSHDATPRRDSDSWKAF